LRLSAGGGQADEHRFFEELMIYASVAILFIYALFAVMLGSYIKPVLILLAIPFGFVGAVVGHVLFGLSFSIYSIAGVVAASGVVVNDALVLTDGVESSLRENRGQGREVSLAASIRAVAATRFRPIVLTTVTTFAGLTPIMLETSYQAQFLIPMAVSLAFGVVMATPACLLLVPAAYLVLWDLQAWLGLEPATAISVASGGDEG